MTEPFLYGTETPSADMRIFGQPGGSLHSAGFDQRSTNAGVDGEKRVGAMLERLADRHPSLYVFHSVKLPGHFGDFDHVVMFGRTILVIDTKNWKSSASYSIAKDEVTVLRDGKPFDGGKVSVGRYVQDMIRYAGPDMDVEGMLVVANNRSKTSGGGLGWGFVNITELEAHLERAIRSESAAPAEPEEVVFLSSRVVNPDFDGAWEPIVHRERSVKRDALPRPVFRARRRVNPIIGVIRALVAVLALLVTGYALWQSQFSIIGVTLGVVVLAFSAWGRSPRLALLGAACVVGSSVASLMPW